jgi:hypothetical protein
MKEYKFLLKPAFFIFNLFFATWLVLKIEQVKPSDFGKYERFLTPHQVVPAPAGNEKLLLKTLLNSYKNGQLDSIHAEMKIEEILKTIKGNTGK